MLQEFSERLEMFINFKYSDKEKRDWVMFQCPLGFEVISARGNCGIAKIINFWGIGNQKISSVLHEQNKNNAVLKKWYMILNKS